MSTLAVILITFTSFVLLFKISRPLNKFRTVIIISMITLFLIGFIFFKELFVIADINLELFIVIIILMILSTIMYNVFTKAFDYYLLKRSLDN